MNRRALLTLVLLLAGCGYFNSLYNANRFFADAERSTRSGDRVTAARQYREAIDRAAVSYRSHPDGRWADDALLLVGRARFALGEYDAAAAAMRALLGQARDAAMRALGHAYLGASLLELGENDAAGAHLDSAVVVLRDRTDEAAFVRLWRARAAFAAGRTDAGWSDLAQAAYGPYVLEAVLEGAARAITVRDSSRAIDYMRRLAGIPAAGRVLERVDTLLQRAAEEWSPSFALRASLPFVDAPWPDQPRDEIALRRAHIALDAGDRDAALELALRVANDAARGAGSRARRLAAAIRLERADSAAELEEIRGLLLSAYDDPQALDLMRRIRAAQILVQNGADPASSLSLFAAAEFLRDDLGARSLARTLFLRYATQQQNDVWSGKAALAAHLIDPSADTEAALARLAANPYVIAARGGPPAAGAIDRAELQLAYGLEGLRESALAEAIRRDAMVGRAVAVLDSTRIAARNDSIRIACGAFVDSLGIAGIRADSTRSACLRGDSARVAFVLRADTVVLRDTAAAPRTVRPDTTSH